VRIVAVRARAIGYSRPPHTLRRHLVSNASLHDDFDTKAGGWFGETFNTVVEVQTADGTVGTGTAGAFGGGAKAIVDQYLADLVLDEDVRRHEFIWQRMYRTLARFGRGAPTMTAISAIDIACWDAHARAEGRSVVGLLGGAAQTRVPAYASRLYALEDLDALAEEARGYASEGFSRLKQRFGFGPRDGHAGMRRNIELVQTVRDAIGLDVELAADAYMGWDIGYAIQMADRLRDQRLSWIEEPLMPEQVDRYAELRQRVPGQRWTCGEHAYGKWDIATLISAGATDILQPDTNRVGGITEARKICALAEAAGLPVIPHSNEAHNLAVIFSQPAHVCPVVEYFPNVEPDTGNELFWKLFSGNPVHEGGYVALDVEAPGLGVTLDEDAVGEYLVEDGDWVAR
jgi:L-alanine-DL-glutamate epimerase-like enolase superfamily enzyme